MWEQCNQSWAVVVAVVRMFVVVVVVLAVQVFVQVFVAVGGCTGWAGCPADVGLWGRWGSCRWQRVSVRGEGRGICGGDPCPQTSPLILRHLSAFPAHAT